MFRNLARQPFMCHPLYKWSLKKGQGMTPLKHIAFRVIVIILSATHILGYGLSLSLCSSLSLYMALSTYKTMPYRSHTQNSIRFSIYLIISLTFLISTLTHILSSTTVTSMLIIALPLISIISFFVARRRSRLLKPADEKEEEPSDEL